MRQNMLVGKDRISTSSIKTIRKEALTGNELISTSPKITGAKDKIYLNFF